MKFSKRTAAGFRQFLISCHQADWDPANTFSFEYGIHDLSFELDQAGAGLGLNTHLDHNVSRLEEELAGRAGRGADAFGSESPHAVEDQPGNLKKAPFLWRSSHNYERISEVLQHTFWDLHIRFSGRGSANLAPQEFGLGTLLASGCQVSPHLLKLLRADFLVHEIDPFLCGVVLHNLSPVPSPYAPPPASSIVPTQAKESKKEEKIVQNVDKDTFSSIKS
jgi:hypothetical protein